MIFSWIDHLIKKNLFFAITRVELNSRVHSKGRNTRFSINSSRNLIVHMINKVATYAETPLEKRQTEN